MTALVTSALLFSGSIDALKSAVVLTSLPFSLILLLMMWGLHKAFYLESQKKIARMHSLAPVSASRRGRGGWRQRLSQAVHFPSRDEVYRFMDTTVRPAIEEVRRCSCRERPERGHPARPGQRQRQPGNRPW
jgi:choline/glycine/proline betaine transport protein